MIFQYNHFAHKCMYSNVRKTILLYGSFGHVELCDSTKWNIMCETIGKQPLSKKNVIIRYAILRNAYFTVLMQASTIRIKREQVCSKNVLFCVMRIWYVFTCNRVLFYTHDVYSSTAKFKRKYTEGDTLIYTYNVYTQI